MLHDLDRRRAVGQIRDRPHTRRRRPGQDRAQRLERVRAPVAGAARAVPRTRVKALLLAPPGSSGGLRRRPRGAAPSESRAAVRVPKPARNRSPARSDECERPRRARPLSRAGSAPVAARSARSATLPRKSRSKPCIPITIEQDVPGERRGARSSRRDPRPLDDRRDLDAPAPRDRHTSSRARDSSEGSGSNPGVSVREHVGRSPVASSPWSSRTRASQARARLTGSQRRRPRVG